MSDHSLPKLTQAILDEFEEHIEQVAKEEGDMAPLMLGLSAYVEEHNPLLFEVMKKYAQAHADSYHVLFDFVKIYALLQSQQDEHPITIH